MEITPFKEAIKKFLDTMAAEDPAFKEKYENPKKSVEECCKYIIQEVKKGAGKESSVAVSDEEVYGLAIHYYDEEDIVVEKQNIPVAVTTSANATGSKPTESKKRKPRIKKEKPLVDENIPEPLEFPIF